MENSSVIKGTFMDIMLSVGGGQGEREWRGAIAKGHILYDSIYIAFWKWQNYRNES